MTTSFSIVLKSTALIAVAGIGLSMAIVGHADMARAAPADGVMKPYMVDTVMTAMQSIWDGSYADKLTDADWTEMQQSATKLLATIPVIASGGPTQAGQARAKMPKWQEWTKKMDAEVKVAKTAADKKDQMALATAGDNLVEICGGCHTDFDPTAGKY
jgi:cytochrome c556